MPSYSASKIARWHEMVGNPKTERVFLFSRFTMCQVEQIKKSLFIVQGTNDPRVNKFESDQIVAAMRKKSLPVEYLVFPNEEHDIRRPENVLRLAAATEDFLARHLGGLCEPPSKEEERESLQQ